MKSIENKRRRQFALDGVVHKDVDYERKVSGLSLTYFDFFLLLLPFICYFTF